MRVNGQPVPPGFSGTGNWDTDTLIHRFAPLDIEGDDTGDDSALGYQFLVGAQIRAGRNIQAFVGYRYLRSEDIEIKNLTGGFQTHGIEAGVRFLFD